MIYELDVYLDQISRLIKLAEVNKAIYEENRIKSILRTCKQSDRFLKLQEAFSTIDKSYQIGFRNKRLYMVYETFIEDYPIHIMSTATRPWKDYALSKIIKGCIDCLPTLLTVEQSKIKHTYYFHKINQYISEQNKPDYVNYCHSSWFLRGQLIGPAPTNDNEYEKMLSVVHNILK